VKQDEQLKAGLREGFSGVLTDAEVDCVTKEVFSHKDVEVGQLIDFAAHPRQSGPVFDVYKAAFQACADTSAALPPKKPEGELRDSVIAGFRSVIPQLTDEQADCLIDRLYDQGVGVREMALSGYIEAELTKIQPKVAAVGQECLQG
jgi:hypothetical protein